MKKKVIFCFAIFSIFYAKLSIADDYFEPSLLGGYSNDDETPDLSTFYKKNGQVAGTYFTYVYFNNNIVKQGSIRFDYNNDSKSQLVPLITKRDYIKFGVLSNATPTFSQLSDDDIINISDVIPDSFFKYDFYQNKLLISVPQMYVNKTIEGQAFEKMRDHGVDSLFTSYYYSGSTTKNKHYNTANNSYLNLRSGLNLGSWRFRNYSTYAHSDQQDKWDNVSNYIEKDINALKSRLTFGDSYTSSEMFDSFLFRGVKLSSDDAMLPSNQRGFAPIVKGVAQSDAEVTIKQNGVVIKKINVSPGPFIIDDLYPTSSGGNLEVTVKESNGSTSTFIQPFSAVPTMLREGGFKYSVVAGQYRNIGDSESKPNFFQFTGIYGLPYDLTTYGGAIVSKDYKSVLFGFGKSLGDLGSISTDVTFAKSKQNNNSDFGSSYRLQYSKDVLGTGTSFSFVGYRYSTAGYRTFSDVSDYRYNDWQKNQNKKNTMQMNISQNLGAYFGNLYLVGYRQSYWNKKDKTKTINFGYNNSYQDISYSLNYSYSKSNYDVDSSKLFSLSVAIPLSKFLPKSNINLATNIDDKSKTYSTIGLSGYALDDDSLYYNAQTSYSSKTDDKASGSISTNYRSRFGEYQVGYNYSDNTQQLNYAAGGSIVIHPYGLTFGQPLGDTSILVKAKDANHIIWHGP